MKRYTAHFFFISAVILIASGLARWSLGDHRRAAYGITLGIVWFLAGLYYQRRLKGPKDS